jgi:hypothetical protein
VPLQSFTRALPRWAILEGRSLSGRADLRLFSEPLDAERSGDNLKPDRDASASTCEELCSRTYADEVQLPRMNASVVVNNLSGPLAECVWVGRSPWIEPSARRRRKRFDPRPVDTTDAGWDQELPFHSVRRCRVGSCVEGVTAVRIRAEVLARTAVRRSEMPWIGRIAYESVGLAAQLFQLPPRRLLCGCYGPSTEAVLSKRRESTPKFDEHERGTAKRGYPAGFVDSGPRELQTARIPRQELDELLRRESGMRTKVTREEIDAFARDRESGIQVREAPAPVVPVELEAPVVTIPTVAPPPPVAAAPAVPLASNPPLQRASSLERRALHWTLGILLVLCALVASGAAFFGRHH